MVSKIKKHIEIGETVPSNAMSDIYFCLVTCLVNIADELLTCKDAVVVSMVVTTGLVVKSLAAVTRNTDATAREAKTILSQTNRPCHVLTR